MSAPTRALPRSAPAWRRDYARMAEVAARKGFSERDLAELFGLDPAGFCEWRAARPELSAAVARGRGNADARAERMLLAKALGLTCTETTVKTAPVRGEDGSLCEEVRERRVVKKRLPPDFQALKLWLSRRRPGLWGQGEADGGAADPDDLSANLSEEEIDARIRELERQLGE
ncbi:hypothetical protein dsx2_1527 [Desulfovibrio sp. X2]|uniref:hypothetical protein n=1 Tax=Desulfovibrio sp. X2 TaxID=941449 RepID=UPI000358EF43|nr:hypothetical protein [Desulfovibrio sp. X2]EPR44568.1 hypothetical protein dsx2_1527 [Desulfovibrio sp. X2]